MLPRDVVRPVGEDLLRDELGHEVLELPSQIGSGGGLAGAGIANLAGVSKEDHLLPVKPSPGLGDRDRS